MTAAGAFFVLAAAGLLGGVTVWECSLRSVAGAFVLYVVLRVAGWVAASIIASAAVKPAGASEPVRSDSGAKRI